MPKRRWIHEETNWRTRLQRPEINAHCTRSVLRVVVRTPSSLPTTAAAHKAESAVQVVSISIACRLRRVTGTCACRRCAMDGEWLRPDRGVTSCALQTMTVECFGAIEIQYGGVRSVF